MKTRLLFGGALSVLCGMVLPSFSATTLAAENTAVTTGSRLSADLARADRGARLEVSGANAEAAQVLLGQDSAATYALPAGTTSMILALPKIEVVDHFDFVTNGAAGKVTVSVSSTKLPFHSADWREVVGAQDFGGSQLIPCDLGSVDARYVKLDFDTASAGKLSGFNLFGASAPAARAKGEFHVTVVTPAKSSIEGSVAFDAANPAPKVVADLGDGRALSGLTCAYDAPAGRLDFYLVDDASLPAGAAAVGLNYVGEPSLQPVANDATASSNGLAGKRPIYSVDTAAQPGSGKVTADLGKLSGHYLVAAFRPAARHHATDGKDVKDGVADVSKGKDAKEAPVFPVFSGPPSFGNPPTDSGTPLLPPAVRPPPIGNNSD